MQETKATFTLEQQNITDYYEVIKNRKSYGSYLQYTLKIVMDSDWKRIKKKTLEILDKFIFVFVF